MKILTSKNDFKFSFSIKFHLITRKLIYNNFIKTKLSQSVPSVFLTHVGIQQMPPWLPTWKAKSLYHVDTFLPKWFFSATSKVQNYQNKTPEKSLSPSKYVLTTYLKEFQRYSWICLLYSLSLANCKQLRKCNRLYRLLLSATFFFNRY